MSDEFNYDYTMTLDCSLNPMGAASEVARLRAENERLLAERLRGEGELFLNLRAEVERLRAIVADTDNEAASRWPGAAHHALPTKTIPRGAGFVVRLLVVPVYEGESDEQALATLRDEATDE